MLFFVTSSLLLINRFYSAYRYFQGISHKFFIFRPFNFNFLKNISRFRYFSNNDVVIDSYPDFEVVWYGHIGDGNLHLNILKPDDMDKEIFFERCGHVSKWLFEIVERYKGSVSAEHGVGILKKQYLSYCKSEQEIGLMKNIKQIFDPKGIMNPGKVID